MTFPDHDLHQQWLKRREQSDVLTIRRGKRMRSDSDDARELDPEYVQFQMDRREAQAEQSFQLLK